jgi:rhomboid protease GluP
MLEMDTVDEVSPPKSSDLTPPPRQAGEIVLPYNQPTPTAVLGWIAESTGQPWFPSQHVATIGTDRDALDEPLTQLRVAGLIRIATWVRWVGQGYILTPLGEKALAAGTGIPINGKPPEPLSSGSFSAIPDDPTMPLELQSSAMAEEQTAWLPIDPRPQIVVPALLIANVLWFFVSLIAAIRVGVPIFSYLLSGNGSIAHRFGSVAGIDLIKGDWWRLITSCFVHGSGVHLLVNLFALAMIGPLAELVWGRRRFGVIYLLSGLAGSSLAMALHPQDGVVGASGAIWGVLMSLVVWFVVFRAELPPDVVVDANRRLLLVIAINIMVSFVPGVSWQSHLGGGIAGLVAAGLMYAIIVGDIKQRRIAIGLLFSLPVLSVGGLIVVMGRGENWIAFREQLAQEQIQRAADAASKSFDQEVRPILLELNPYVDSSEQPSAMPNVIWHGKNVQLPPASSVQQAAVIQLLRPPERRNPIVVKETKAALNEKRALANKAVELLSSSPVGKESVDRIRGRAKEFAEAQSRSLGLLLDMLASDKIPDENAWTVWGNAKHKAQALWQSLLQKNN